MHDPKFWKSNTDTVEPIRAKLRIDTPLPSSTKFRTERVELAALSADRNDKELPK
jgi:hypothetical protein